MNQFLLFFRIRRSCWQIRFRSILCNMGGHPEERNDDPQENRRNDGKTFFLRKKWWSLYWVSIGNNYINDGFTYLN